MPSTPSHCRWSSRAVMPAQVADAVGVRVHVGARVDLVEHAVAPPRAPRRRGIPASDDATPPTLAGSDPCARNRHCWQGSGWRRRGLAFGRGPHACVPRVAREELVVAAVLHDAAVVDHDDAVGEARGLEPVRDQDRRAPVRGDAHRRLHLRFGLEVEVRGRLVEEQDRGIDQVGSRSERDELALTRRQRPAALAHPLQVATRQRSDEVVRADLARRGLDLGVASRPDVRTRCCRGSFPRTGTPPAARRRAAGGTRPGRSRGTGTPSTRSSPPVTS